MFALLDPTAYLPLQVEQDELPEFLSTLDGIIELLLTSNGSVTPSICEDTALVIFEEYGALQARGGYYRLCASTLVQVSNRHLLPLDRFLEATSAELDLPVSSEVEKKYSRDKFKCFASVAASGLIDEHNNTFIISNKYTLLPAVENKLSLLYLSRNADIELLSAPFLDKTELLLDSYGIVDPSIVKELKTDKPVQFVWEKTGHTASPHQKRVIETTCKNSGVVIRSATTYHNPHGPTDRSVVQLRDAVDEVHFTVCDNGDVLCGIFKTRATTLIEAKTCLHLISTHFRNALER